MKNINYLDIFSLKGGEKFQKELKKSGYNAAYEHFDVTNLKIIEAKINELNEKYGKIDVWVNTAYPRTKDWPNEIDEITLGSWRKNIDMHMNSYCWMSQKVCLVMKRQKKRKLN